MAAGHHAAHDTEHAELLATVTESLCTRALNRFAEESRLDGESLQDAVARYEIDYAWQVLGSDRLRDETLARLEAKLGHAASAVQTARVVEVLKAAAAGQASDLLMSFDNDVAEQLAQRLHAQQAREAAPAAEALG